MGLRTIIKFKFPACWWWKTGKNVQEWIAIQYTIVCEMEEGYGWISRLVNTTILLPEKLFYISVNVHNIQDKG